MIDSIPVAARVRESYAARPHADLKQRNVWIETVGNRHSEHSSIV